MSDVTLELEMLKNANLKKALGDLYSSVLGLSFLVEFPSKQERNRFVSSMEVAKQVLELCSKQ